MCVQKYDKNGETLQQLLENYVSNDRYEYAQC